MHQTLGRYRHDDDRHSGWISGLSDAEGALHPTRGGLRIGKSLPERGLGEAYDEPLEWDRDGQYFHYLTQWMHALDLTARQTREPRFNVWARELAERACDAFSYLTPTDQRRMFWKMSIDLTRPLVSSMSAHDPVDGLVTCLELSETAERLGVSERGPSLEGERVAFAAMASGASFATADPLGIGGLLVAACRLARLGEAASGDSGALVSRLASAAIQGTKCWVEDGRLRRPASERLAFRELGMAIGLRAAELMPELTGRLLDGIRPFIGLGQSLAAFWLEPERRMTSTWREHRDINEVMLATSLLPHGFLGAYDSSLAGPR